MGCNLYLILTLYVRWDRILLGALRLLKSIEGRIVYVDEETRRVTAIIPAASLENAKGIVADYASGHVVNVKASCNVESLSVVEEKLKAFKESVRKGPDIYYLNVNGRIVEVRFRGGRRVDVKIGGGSSLTRILPPSVFNLSIEEAGEALGELRALLGSLGLI